MKLKKFSMLLLLAMLGCKREPLQMPEISPESEAYQFIHGSIQPEKVKFQPPEPVYPKRAQRTGKQSVVIIGMDINEEGQVTETHVFGGTTEFRNTAVKYARQWLFEPPIVDGKPVRSRFLLHVVFKLK